MLSQSAEEGASFAIQLVAQLETSLDMTRKFIACELLGTIRLVRRRGVAGDMRGAFAQAYDRAESTFEADDADADLRPDLDRLAALV
ncbi:hypothetical protein GW571_14990 (plasmid) [Clavibacter capsici]|uniref:Uncharacterized protein n=1 Tax=Clavibacter capsici TaxID=1874630 RepID=A0A0M5JPD1_9MICO|nr:hypothetical protein [Clavibacter capsici]ALD14397.1 hypothetical protein AES38_15040 [Clavibacter capsici]QIS40532.1 hypothetical protein GW572_15230 [Clavibacter capsici]QIS43537.1 hypothetical protein GW571_14990 [Clavibacter capsici]QIS46417.1 hypothetical protein GW570_14570 [Clavibacter capsici]